MLRQEVQPCRINVQFSVCDPLIWTSESAGLHSRENDCSLTKNRPEFGSHFTDIIYVAQSHRDTEEHRFNWTPIVTGHARNVLVTVRVWSETGTCWYFQLFQFDHLNNFNVKLIFYFETLSCFTRAAINTCVHHQINLLIILRKCVSK